MINDIGNDNLKKIIDKVESDYVHMYSGNYSEKELMCKYMHLAFYTSVLQGLESKKFKKMSGFLRWNSPSLNAELDKYSYINRLQRKEKTIEEIDNIYENFFKDNKDSLMSFVEKYYKSNIANNLLVPEEKISEMIISTEPIYN